MGKFYKQEGENWIGDISTIEHKDFSYNAEDFVEDEDLLDGWMFRLEPPIEYLEWLEEKNNSYE